jgi:prolyl-tRNA editing enzyme YbaK/EbsC (Cys-tRNA(Pro) deacylase)
VGGTSPFGTRKALPTFMERSITALPAIYINGGRRGFLLKVSTADLLKTLNPKLVDVALED